MRPAPTPSEALAQGWSVIPCNQNKQPIIKTWKPFQERQAKPDEVAQWVRRDPAAWAIVTGNISKRIALDFDGVSGKATCDKLQLRPHRSTPSGGVHVDFDHPGWHVPTLNSKTKRELGARWPGLDIRGDGGYVIFSGQTGHGDYSWMRDPDPESLDALPLDLREFLGLLRPHHPPGQPNKLNGLNYATLEEYRTTFDLRTIRNVIIKQNLPEGDDSSIFEIFNRLNSGGVNLTPQEIRISLYHSRFYEMLQKLNLVPEWRRILGLPQPDLHMKDLEIVLRGFAMFMDGENYRPSMASFLNRFSNQCRNISEERIRELKRILISLSSLARAFLRRPFMGGLPENSISCCSSQLSPHKRAQFAGARVTQSTPRSLMR